MNLPISPTAQKLMAAQPSNGANSCRRKKDRSTAIQYSRILAAWLTCLSALTGRLVRRHGDGGPGMDGCCCLVCHVVR